MYYGTIYSNFIVVQKEAMFSSDEQSEMGSNRDDINATDNDKNKTLLRSRPLFDASSKSKSFLYPAYYLQLRSFLSCHGYAWNIIKQKIIVFFKH